MEKEARLKQLYLYYVTDQCTVQELEEFFMLLGHEINDEEIKLLLGETFM